MSFKSKAFAAAATLTLVGGVGAMAATAANAATPSAGPQAVDWFSKQFGTHHSPNFVLDVYRQGAKVGQPIILFRSSNSDPAEDFTVAEEGTVDEFEAADLVSPALALQYGELPAVEITYSPYGVDSGLCVGTSTTAGQGAKVVLDPCGVSSKTVWVYDYYNTAGFDNSYIPLINGSDTNFSHPYVLTYPTNGYPTDLPRPQLETDTLTGQPFSPGNFSGVDDTQLWGQDHGVLQG